MFRHFRSLIVVALLAATVNGAAAQTTPVNDVTRVAVKALSDVLGLSPADEDAPATLDVGGSVTFQLIDPAKLARHTSRRIKAGARVILTRVAADRIYVDAEETDAMPVTDKVTLRINHDGTLSPLYRRVPVKYADRPPSHTAGR